MKQSIFRLLAVFAIVLMLAMLAACDEEKLESILNPSGGEPDTHQDLVGTWVGSKTSRGENNGAVIEQTSSYVLVFTADGGLSLTVTLESYKVDGVETEDGTTSVANYGTYTKTSDTQGTLSYADSFGGSHEGTYSYTGDSVTISTLEGVTFTVEKAPGPVSENLKGTWYGTTSSKTENDGNVIEQTSSITLVFTEERTMSLTIALMSYKVNGRETANGTDSITYYGTFKEFADNSGRVTYADSYGNSFKGSYTITENSVAISTLAGVEFSREPAPVSGNLVGTWVGNKSSEGEQDGDLIQQTSYYVFHVAEDGSLSVSITMLSYKVNGEEREDGNDVWTYYGSSYTETSVTSGNFTVSDPYGFTHDSTYAIDEGTVTLSLCPGVTFTKQTVQASGKLVGRWLGSKTTQYEENGDQIEKTVTLLLYVPAEGGMYFSGTASYKVNGVSAKDRVESDIYWGDYVENTPVSGVLCSGTLLRPIEYSISGDVLSLPKYSDIALSKQ